MKSTSLFTLFLALFTTALLLSGCGSEDGQSLFNDDEEISVDETTENVYADDEFGYLVEGTKCIKQIHGGCVPTDYSRMESKVFGIHFDYPSTWFISGSSEAEVVVSPQNITGENDPTRLYIWRQAAEKTIFADASVDVVDAGKGVVGLYDVAWEIHEGTFNNQPVYMEWIRLTYDVNNPWANYTFFLITEEDSFEADQLALKGAVSSIFKEDFEF